MTEEFIYNSADSVSLEPQQEPQFVCYDIVGQENPILTTALEDFDFSDTSINPAEIASRLVETAKTFNLFGLSANQCGLPHKFCVVGNDDQYVAFFNPEILEYYGDDIVLPETDISNYGLVLNIKRPKNIIVKYITFEGNENTLRLEGITSRIVQQQIDRLNGIDFKSKVSKYTLDRKKKSLSKKIKRYVRQNILVK